jgi:hypothetical protein
LRVAMLICLNPTFRSRRSSPAGNIIREATGTHG